ncbi:MAG: single-stranded DNA-binding protein [Kineosporiaceae bacterium]
MFNGTQITVRGHVATDPVHRVTEPGATSLCSFRVAVTARRWSAVERRAVDVDTSFYTVTCWRQLADNAVASLRKGDGVVVTGRLRVRDFVHDEQQRTSADIVADAVGHDLTWGTAEFSRVTRTERADHEQAAADALAEAVAAAPVEPVTPPDTGAGHDEPDALAVAGRPEPVPAGT